MIQPPFSSAVPNSGTNTVPPSSSGPWSVMPTAPPHGRSRLRVTIFYWRKAYAKMPPSEELSSLINPSFGRLQDARIGIRGFVIARKAGSVERPPQSFDQQLGNIAAAVVANVDHQAFLTDLRIPPFDEFTDTRLPHVRYVNVAQAPLARAIHPGAILGDPSKIQEAVFAAE